jgi:hypothetical protein
MRDERACGISTRNRSGARREPLLFPFGGGDRRVRAQAAAHVRRKRRLPAGEPLAAPAPGAPARFLCRSERSGERAHPCPSERRRECVPPSCRAERASRHVVQNERPATPWGTSAPAHVILSGARNERSRRISGRDNPEIPRWCLPRNDMGDGRRSRAYMSAVLEGHCYPSRRMNPADIPTWQEAAARGSHGLLRRIFAVGSAYQRPPPPPPP